MDELVKCTNSYNILEHGGETPRRISFDAFDGPRFIDHEYLDHDFLFGKKEEYLDYEPNSNPRRMMVVEQKIDLPRKRPSPLLVAAKMGVREMVEKILDEYPVAIEDSDQEGKNVVLLAIENRHPQVYIFLKEKYSKKPYIFQKIDTQGNSALHMAAHLQGNWSWRIPRSVVQMHQEIKWYKFVKSSMPQDFFFRRNKKRKTPKEVFIETHGQLLKDVNEWLNRISEACSVVAALVASVAFATAAAVPGGTKPEGVPTLEGKPAFNVFGLASVVAFCSSVTSLVLFLSLLASRYQYALDFPLKLFLGFTTLFVSIASMMVSFLSGNLFVLDDGLRHVAYLLYAALCLPLIYLALRQLSLYLDLLGSILLKLPKYSQM
ncbi:Ankyrin repeat-containing protein [Parasponia andersonii]|uniref:Ankyrin repeat-containing protein n=1 Tax=Parasponia andersonii TaxID=3476 RepID=A0A2P5CRP6_PARAD|nr:Ankyrin repeat-containing protein [Parasponia andersonii]